MGTSNSQTRSYTYIHAFVHAHCAHARMHMCACMHARMRMGACTSSSQKRSCSAGSAAATSEVKAVVSMRSPDISRVW